MAVAMLGLAVGMGLWWNYFDALGRRVPSKFGVRLATWTYIHLPLTASIAAAGAAMVSLIEHAEDGRTPEAIAWLLGGSVALVLLCVGLASRALDPDDYPGRLLERVPGTLAAGAMLAVAAAAVRPRPVWFLAALLAVLSLTWLTLIVQFFAAGARVGGAAEAGETETA